MQCLPCWLCREVCECALGQDWLTVVADRAGPMQAGSRTSCLAGYCFLQRKNVAGLPVWQVTEDGQIVETHRGTRGSGKYHDYPSTLTNGFENEINDGTLNSLSCITYG